MLDAGWIEETEALLQQGLLESPTACQALGYRDIADFLAGRIGDRDALAETIARRTIRFARKQCTWFRNQHPDAQILHVSSEEEATTLAQTILGRYREATGS